MTITSRVNRATMDGNGVSTTLAIDFPFHSVEDLIVIETIIATGAETTKVLNTDYTVGGAQDDAGHFPDGGEITFTTPPASTVRMVVYRDPPMLQGVVLQETGKIPVKAAIESPLDKLTMIDQRLSERIDRALRLSDGDSLEMGRLPVKGVRASRYLGFDGDGNPTMMQTPTGVVTSLAQLTESLKAALPAAGAAGSLRKVTDDVRGVWMDTGAQWIQITGHVANVKDFGAKGDDATDDTAAFVSAVAALPTGGTLYIPPGVYRIDGGNVTIPSYVSVLGAGIGVSILKNTNVAGADLLLFTDSTTSNKELRFGSLKNIELRGNADSGHGVVVENAYHFCVELVHMTEHGGIGLTFDSHVNGSTYGQNMFVTRSFFLLNLGGGIRLSGSGNIATIDRCSINQNGFYGVYADRHKQLAIKDCELADYYYSSAVSGNQGIPVVINGGSAVTVENCSFEANGGQGTTPNAHIKTGWDGDLQSATLNDVQGLTINGNDFKSTSGAHEGALNHVDLNRARGVEFIRNFFEKEGGYGYIVNGVTLGSDMLTNGGLVFRNNTWDALDAKLTGVSRPFIFDDVYFDSATGSAPVSSGRHATDTAHIVFWNRYATDAYDNFQILGNGCILRGSGASAPTTGIYSGSGSPEGVVTAGIGSLYQRSDGGTGTSLYVKESGTGNTGWIAK